MKTITPDRDASAKTLINRLGLKAVVARPERRETLLRRVQRLANYRRRFFEVATHGNKQQELRHD